MEEECSETMAEIRIEVRQWAVFKEEIRIERSELWCGRSYRCLMMYNN